MHRGLEADQKVIAAHGCYAMTATTALTAQNTLGVYGIHTVPVDFLKQQLDACFDDIGVDVVKTGEWLGTHRLLLCHLAAQLFAKEKKRKKRKKKKEKRKKIKDTDSPSPRTGMLASADTIKLVADTLEQRAVSKSVVDPVRLLSSALCHRVIC